MPATQRIRLLGGFSVPFAACVLLASCVHRAGPTTSTISPPVVTQAAGGEHETHRRLGLAREDGKAYWDRIAAYKRASEQTRAFRARLGMNESASPRASSSSGPNPFTWTFLGPQPILTSDSSNPFSGSIRDVILDPHNSSVLYVVTYLGKVWKTIDAGQTWVPLLDYGPVTVVDELVADPVRPNTLYAENGDLFVSSDGGQSWTSPPPVVGDATQLGCLTAGFAVSPSGAAWLALEVCSVHSVSGLYRSTDRGATWNLVLQHDAVRGDIRFNAGNDSYAYLATVDLSNNGSVHISTNQGATWSDISSGVGFVSPFSPSSLESLQLAPATSSPNTLYLLAGWNQGIKAGNVLYKTTDAGASWQQAANLPPDSGTPRTPGLIAVHPLDPNLVFFGSVHLFRSQDGGDTWQNAMTAVSGLTLHLDQHALVFTPDGRKLYEANDGGIWAATKPYGSQIDWTNINTGLGTAEIYSVAIDPENTNRAFAGTQDNSTLQFSGSPGWAQAAAGVCGDGWATGIDSSSPTTVYALCNGGIFKSASAPSSWVRLDPSVLNFEDANFTLDNSTPNTLYVWPAPGEAYGLYQSLDAGNTWRQISMLPTNAVIHQVAVSQSNPDVVYLLVAEGGLNWEWELWATQNARSNASPTWQNVIPPGSSVGFTGWPPLAVDPANSGTLALLIEHLNPRTDWVLKSADGGATWLRTPVSGALSGLVGSFVSDLLIDPDLPNTWYLAVAFSVYRSSDAGRTWYPLATGFPIVETGGTGGAGGFQLHRGSRTLWAATAGRGVWELSVPLTAPRINAIAPQSTAVAAAATLTISGENFDANSVVQINGQSMPTSFVGAAELQAAIPANVFPDAGLYYVTVYKPGNSGGVSDPQLLAVGTVIYDGGIVNAADPLNTAVIPGAIMSIYGASLAPTTMTGTVPLPTDLQGVQVLVDNVPAPLMFVSPGQINFVVPWEVVSPEMQTTIVVQNNGVLSPPIQGPMWGDAAAVFTLNQQGQGAVLIANTGIIAAPLGAFPGSRPAKRGEYIEIYATGLGPVHRPPPDGEASGSLDWTLNSCDVLWSGGGANANVIYDKPTYVGLTPSFPGLYQIDIQVPDTPGLLTGDAVQLAISCGNAPSNIFTIAIE